MSRTGDPTLASAAKTWTQAHKPFASPVQRSIPELVVKPTQSTAPANLQIGPVTDRQQYLDGDFNTGNGGVWPKGNVKY